MTGFEFLFTFYSFLLGLAIANIATDFADMWRERNNRMTGTVTIMLGFFILLCVAHQWISFWSGREFLEMSSTNLLICIGIAFPYIFVSQAMFPSQHDDCVSLDDYYMAHNRILLGVLLVPIIVSLTFNLLRGIPMEWKSIVYFSLRIGIPVLMMIYQIRWLHRLGLSLLIATLFIRIYS